MPDMHPLDSSLIAAVGHDAEKLELHVRFVRSGATYVYYDVEAEILQNLINAASSGRYFNTLIKGHYREAKVQS